MKPILKVFFGLVLLLLILLLAIEVFAPPFIKSSLQKELIYYKSDTLEIGEVDIHYLPLGLSLRDVQFDLHLPMDSILVKWTGKVGIAKVAGINWWQAWKGNKWEVGHIEIGEGSINWQVTDHSTIDTMRFGNTGSSVVKPNILFENISVDKLNLTLQRDSFFVRLQTWANVEDFHLIRKKKMEWDVGRVVFHSADGFFENIIKDNSLGYKSIHYDSADSILNISGFMLKPRLSREKFRKKYPYRVVQSSLDIARISLLGIDPGKLNSGLFAQSLLIDSCFAEVYQDTRIERENVRKLLPSEMVASIPFVIEIDTMYVRNSYVQYEHKALDNKKLAYLGIDKMEAMVYPISNRGHSNCADLTIDGKLRLMKEADLHLFAKFFPDKQDHDFSLEITLGPTAFTKFNPILYPSLGIKAKKGQCHKAHVSIMGNDYVGRGILRIEYSGLKIALPPDQESGLSFLGKTGEFLGNMALVNRDNSYGNKDSRIYYDRDLKQPFINYWWKCIQSGLIPALINFKVNEKEQN